MDRSESYMNVKMGTSDSWSPSRAEAEVSYAELNFQTTSSPRVRTDRGAQKQEPKPNTRNRTPRKIFLLCLVTFVLVAIVAGFSIYVSQIHHQLTEMETNYRSVNETKDQICELLTSRRVQTCSKDWITNKDRCYYVSTFETPFQKAIQECSSRDSRLLEINSRDEASFVSRNLVLGSRLHWIGKCKEGNVAWGLLYKVSSGKPDCRVCTLYPEWNPCSYDRYFICEKPTPFPEKIQGLCQQPVEST